MDAEIYEVLGSFKDAIDVILEKVEDLEKEIHCTEEDVTKLHSVLFDEILEPARLAFEERSKSDRFDEFNEKYGERLKPYSDTLSKVYDEPDYSFAKDAFEQYDSMEEPKPDSDEFVNAIIDKAENQIEEIKERLGINDSKEVEIKQDENGNTKVIADGEVVASENKEETTEKGSVVPAEKGAIEGQGELNFDVEDEEEKTDPEELKKYEEELARLM